MGKKLYLKGFFTSHTCPRALFYCSWQWRSQRYPVSSGFSRPEDTGEKPLRATVWFSIDHARARDAYVKRQMTSLPLDFAGKLWPVRAGPGSGSPKTPHAFWSLLQPSSFVPIPLWIQRARFKESNYKRKQMRESLNLFWNRFYLFKVNIFVHSAGRRLDQRIKRLHAVVSLTYRPPWRNHCSESKSKAVEDDKSLTGPFLLASDRLL